MVKGKQQVFTRAGLCGLAGVITILSLVKAHRLKENAEERKIQLEGKVPRVIRSASCTGRLAMIGQHSGQQSESSLFVPQLSSRTCMCFILSQYMYYLCGR